jgi:hypothetical protein
MQALLEYCLRTTVKASKKKLNFCEVRSAIWSGDKVSRTGLNWRIFLQKKSAKSNGFLRGTVFGMAH